MSFQAGDVPGAYGNLSITADGAWTYALANSNPTVQALNAGQTLSDALTVRSFDGTTADIQITINGADEIVANIISGSKRGEIIHGTGADDVITPLGGPDIVDARDGNDTIKATIHDGADFYNGGSGTDTIDFSALTSAVTVKLAQFAGVSAGLAIGWQSGADILVSIENVIGSQAGDHIVGNKLANVIEGGPGPDWLTGGGGCDTFVFNKLCEGVDKITDFIHGQDVIQISAAGFGGGLVAGCLRRP